MQALPDGIYDEMKAIAQRRLRRLRPGDTLNTTALVHEAYLRVADHATLVYRDQTHFAAIAAIAMRNVLVDYARQRSALKRGGPNAAHVSLTAVQVAADERAEDILALDEALTRLEAVDARLAEVVTLRYFGGLGVEETAHALSLSPRTVKRDWRTARLWLARALQDT
ncbi:MAG: ECF-type sigma factor [Bacteroidota bacterium]